MAKYNIHAGHNWNVPGASGCFSETKEDRIVKDKVIAMLRAEGHTVYDCTDDLGKTESQNLINIVNKCNQHSVDLDVSIHFNAFNGQAHGVETLQYDNRTGGVSGRICSKISSLGFTNRGIKDGSWLYVVRNTNSLAILIECCFCDNQGDANKYNSDTMARAIVEAILNKTISNSNSSSGSSSSSTSTSTDHIYRIRKTWSDSKSQIGAYKNLESAKAECKEGYTVFDWNGKAVYTNVKSSESTTAANLYRVRKSWDDVKSQLGAYSSIDNAKKNCPSGYTVYDWNGKAVYSNTTSTSAEPNSQLYRVRKTWEDSKSQTGAYKELENAKNNCAIGYSVFDCNGQSVYTNLGETKDEEEINKPETPDKPIEEDISPLKGVSNDTFIEYIGKLAKDNMKETGLLASVTIAQAILESAWGQSELSLKANNLFGMKASLSGNTWTSNWDGKIYAKRSNEEKTDGTIESILSDFRAYDSPQESIEDHSNYLLGAKNGSTLRYEGLKGERDYRKAITIIKNGGYATDSGYVDKICNIIEKYNLDVWDCAASPSELDDIREKVDSMNKTLATVLDVVQKIFEVLGALFKK